MRAGAAAVGAYAALAVAGAGCEERRPEMSLSALEPSRIAATRSVDETTEVAVIGSGLHNHVVVDLDDDRPPTVRDQWRVTVGDREAEVTRVGTGRIEFQVPGGLEPGLYTVAVVDPSSEEAELVDALEVYVPAFGAPELVDDLADPANDDDPTLTADLLEIYFQANRDGGTGGGDIWRATRSSTAEPWGAPVPVAELNSAFTETTPEIAPDGLTIFFSSNRPDGAEPVDVYVASRASRGDAWGAPVLVSELNTADPESATAPDRTLRFLAFSRSTGDWNLYQTSRAQPTDPWDPPALIAELNTAGDEANPYLGPEGLILAFDTDRLGGDDDLFRTRRPTTADPFAAPEPIAELNSDSQDVDPWLSPDGRTIYFASDRSGNYELYRATR